jgi:hypothetical protein
MRDVRMDEGCSISDLVELQQTAGGDGSGGFGSQGVKSDGRDGTCGEGVVARRQWCEPREWWQVAVWRQRHRGGDGVEDGGGGDRDACGDGGGPGGAEERPERAW